MAPWRWCARCAWLVNQRSKRAHKQSMSCLPWSWPLRTTCAPSAVDQGSPNPSPPRRRSRAHRIHDVDHSDQAGPQVDCHALPAPRVLLVKLRLRLLGPLASLIRQPSTNAAPRRSNSVDAAYREVDTALDHLSAALGLQHAA